MIYHILALLLYTAAILLGAVASRAANTNLVGGITNVIGAIIPLIVAAPLLNAKSLQSQKFGVAMAALGGICIALFVMTLNKSFTENKVGIVTPIVFGGAIFLSTVISYFLFKEKLTALETTGLGVLGLGLIIVIYARSTTN
jgi:multidrug transporter EmrE-like cation transporter